MVAERLAEAAAVIRRLPPVRAPGYFNTRPPMIAGFADQVGRQAEPMRLPPPSPAAISRMEKALAWLRWLEPEHAKLIWARSEGTPSARHLLKPFPAPDLMRTPPKRVVAFEGR